MRENSRINEFLTSAVSLQSLFYRLLLWALLPASLYAGSARADEAPPGVLVAARVNATVIGREDFQRELERIQRRKETPVKAGTESGEAELKREALENLIMRELLYQESVRQKIAVDSALVEREIGLLKAKYPTAAQFEENLRQMKMSEAMLREQVARGIAIRNLIQRSVAGDAAVTAEELKRYYEEHRDTFTQKPQVRLSHILVAVDSEWPKYNKKEAGDNLNALRKRALAGEDFAALAASGSDCQSKSKGGDIGWFAAGQLTPEMEKAVAPLKAGDLSGIVEDRFGLHIIKVVERKPAHTPPLDEIREKVLTMARQEKSLTHLQRYVKKLRDAARVEILPQDGD